MCSRNNKIQFNLLQNIFILINQFKEFYFIAINIKQDITLFNKT